MKRREVILIAIILVFAFMSPYFGLRELPIIERVLIALPLLVAAYLLATLIDRVLPRRRAR